MSDVKNDAALVGATGRTDNSKSTYCCYSCNNFGHLLATAPVGVTPVTLAAIVTVDHVVVVTVDDGPTPTVTLNTELK